MDDFIENPWLTVVRIIGNAANMAHREWVRRENRKDAPPAPARRIDELSRTGLDSGPTVRHNRGHEF